jgi:UDPglucose 6-dehydrogenase
VRKKLNVLVVGYGYVGKAVSSIFKKDSLTTIDPKYSKKSISNYKSQKFDIVFVCVDTPKGENFLTLDNVLGELNSEMKKDTLVCCKSTASPEFYYNAQKKYNNINVLFSPEYLSHWNNIKDFNNQKFIIMGGKNAPALRAAKILKSRLPKVKHVRITDIKTAAFIKYSENAFLALKVTFANELYKIHKEIKCNSNFKNFTEMLGLDERIGASHFEVPGRDGMYGWGGHCFTKDNYEFYKFTKSDLLKFLIETNKKHREGRDNK